MKTLTLVMGTALTLVITSVGSAAYAKEPVPPAGTTGESVNRRLEVIQQHTRSQQEPSVQESRPSEEQAVPSGLNQPSTAQSKDMTCLLRPITSGGMAMKAFNALKDCGTVR